MNALQLRRQECTCLGNCNGPDGLGEGWVCSLQVGRTAHDCYSREDGLRHCKLCGGAEGSLPTHCPGKRMTDEMEQAVFAGKLDFKGGAWVVRSPDRGRDNG